jgi:hypothetical protein
MKQALQYTDARLPPQQQWLDMMSVQKKIILGYPDFSPQEMPFSTLSQLKNWKSPLCLD